MKTLRRVKMSNNSIKKILRMHKKIITMEKDIYNIHDIRLYALGTLEEYPDESNEFIENYNMYNHASEMLKDHEIKIKYFKNKISKIEKRHEMKIIAKRHINKNVPIPGVASMILEYL